MLTSLLLIAAIVAITVYTERINRRDALGLTDEVVSAITTLVRREVDAFLTPTSAAVAFLSPIAGEHGVAGSLPQDALLERVLRRILGQLPEVTAIYAGDAEGDFVMVQRQDERVVTKFIRASEGERDVRLIERGPDGEIVSEVVDPDDDFDPARRPWFARAGEADAVAWSDVYRFFTTGALGLTASSRAPTPVGTPVTVVGADLEIDEIGAFLQTLDLGRDGRAAIFAIDGRLVGVSTELPPMAADDVPTVSTLNDAVLAEVFDRVRIEREAIGFETIDGVRYLASATSLASVVDRPWWALLLIPEDEFVGFVSANARRSLLLSTVVVLLATIVAAILTWQGLRSDRRATQARAAERAVLEQARFLEEIAGIDRLGDPADEASIKRFAKLTAEALDARRVSVWRPEADGTRLANIETYDRELGAHTAAAMLRADGLPAAWPRLTGGEPFTVTSDDADPAAVELRQHYLLAAGTQCLETRPVRHNAAVVGALWLEDAHLERSILGARGVDALLASLLGARLASLAVTPEASARAVVEPTALPNAGVPLPANQRGATIALARERHFAREVNAEGGNAALGAQLYPRVAVLQLEFANDLDFARRRQADGDNALDALVETARRVADESGVGYLKLVGDVLVAARGVGTGEDETGDRAAHVLADFALALQPACRRACQQGGRRPAFRFGLDVGSAFGACVGVGTANFNLWGEATRLAARMAETAPPTAIQVTETAYERLARDYLLRRRGTYFVDEVGEMETYLLTGRL